MQILREGCKRSEWEEEGWGWCGVELTLKFGPGSAQVKFQTRGLHTMRDFVPQRLGFYPRALLSASAYLF